MRQINEFLPDIKDYYFITTNGEVISKARTKPIVLKPGLKKNGYLQVSLVQKNGKIKYISIHRLVALAFIENPNNLEQVNHKDGDKQNNRISNLEWVSSKNNILHSWGNNLSRARKGANSNLASISEEKAIEVVELLRTRKYSDKDIELMTGCNSKTIVSRIRRKETWTHLTKEDEVLGKSQKRK